MNTRQKLKPIYFRPTNEEIEALPVDIREFFNLEVYTPPTLDDHVDRFIENLEPNTSFNIKDVEYFLWTDQHELVLPNKLHPILKDRQGLDRARDQNGITFTVQSAAA